MDSPKMGHKGPLRRLKIIGERRSPPSGGVSFGTLVDRDIEVAFWTSLCSARSVRSIGRNSAKVRSAGVG